MKEAIGGTWIFTIVIVMISLFTAFVSISTNYSSTFKVKDKIIAILEDKRGINYTSIARINEELNRIGYNSTGKCIPENLPVYAQNSGTWYGFRHRKRQKRYDELRSIFQHHRRCLPHGSDGLRPEPGRFGGQCGHGEHRRSNAFGAGTAVYQCHAGYHLRRYQLRHLLQRHQTFCGQSEL